MKLIRAACPCGYETRKARSGYHNDKWWFPLFSKDTGTLVDVEVVLPPDDRRRIDQECFGIYRETPRDDKVARRDASAKMKVIADEIQSDFIDQESLKLSKRYASDATFVFDPLLQSTFYCPACANESLFLDQIHVRAICKRDCGNEYVWSDSEEHGCPVCSHRPHSFRTETEDRYSALPRTVSYCPCSSTMNSISHVDGYCPKCGCLPDTYQFNHFWFCGMHHEKMLSYQLPSNFVFILRGAHSATFPNAKHWGDATEDEDSVSGFFCAKCEIGRQKWLKLHAED